jgi:small-conductance mechanosensitive channel
VQSDTVLQSVLGMVILGNSVKAYLLAAGFVLGIVLLLKVYAMILTRRLRPIAERSDTLIDNLVVDLIDRAATPLLAASGFYVLCDTLNTPEGVRKVAHVILIVLGSYYLVTSVIHILEHWSRSAFRARPGRLQPDPQALEHLRVMGRVVVWIVGALLVLTNLGYNINSILATLGVAGVAIGLAVQNILKDIFSYVCILVDKPFVLGDVIRAGTDIGTVESIGIRSTRVRTLSGEELVVPNDNLTTSRIHNLGRLRERRVIMDLCVVYNTEIEKLERIPLLVAEVMREVPVLDLERAHLRGFGSSGLDYEIAFIVKSTDYHEYMNAQEKLNLRLLEVFRKVGIEFAFATQTIYLGRAAGVASDPAAWDEIRKRHPEARQIPPTRRSIAGE